MLSRIRAFRSGSTSSLAVACVCGVCVFNVTSALAGPDWVEAGDAGSSFGSAQFPIRPAGVTQLDSIAGDLAFGVGAPDYEDMYFIRILDPGAFSLTMGFADFNATMYLFNITVNNELLGLLGNDNMDGETLLPAIGQMSTDGTQVIITQPGDYLLAVAGAGRVPVSRSGSIFNLATPFEVSGADGPGGINPLSGWTGVGEQGHYRIVMDATDFPIAPAPGTGMVLGAGLLTTLRRQRRKSV